MLGAELGPQSTHVHIDGAGTAEEVIPPHLVQQLRTGEYPAGMLGQVFQQLELFVGEVKGTATQARGVGAFVDHQLAEADLARTLLVGQPTATSDNKPQSGVDLGRPGAGQQDFVQPPVSADRDQTAFAHHRQDRDRTARRAQQTAKTARGRQVLTRVHQHSVGGSGLQQRGRLCRCRPDGVREQRQRWQYRVGVQLRCQQ